MAKKDHFLIIDTETTQDQLVADFGAVITDRKGNILNQCAVLTNNIYNNPTDHPLFFTSDPNGIWSKKGQDRRYAMYTKMLTEGSRMIASVAAINRWLEKVKGMYDPYMTAYNLPFDLDKCNKTQIDLTIFGSKQFCLWAASQNKWGKTKKYKDFILSEHGFNAPTNLGNMTYKTNAEVMARFILNQPDLPDEPHTALEDIIFYEMPVLIRLLQTEKKKNWLNSGSYNWRDYQVKDHFTTL